MQSDIPPRILTHDERKAAEAAFRGLPSNPGWSQAARFVYEGIISVRRKQGEAQGETMDLAPAAPASFRAEQPVVTGPSREAIAEPQTEATEAEQPDLRTVLKSREEAIRAGLVIDVTPQAQALGLAVPVGMTKSLWNLAITAAHDMSEEEQAVRLRDVLLALRLRFATTQPLLPLFEFPVLLAFPPEPAPQLCSLLALAHGDQATPQALTLVLRNEVAAVITPFTN